MAIVFNDWELQFLQATLNRWRQYKSVGKGQEGDDTFISLVASIQSKVQVISNTPISFSAQENNFIQMLLYASKQDYGRGAGNSVFEDTRSQVQQRTVQLNNDILAKLRGDPIVLINPGETESEES